MNRKTTILIAAVLAATTLSAHAAEVIKPQIGEPLRDAAVTRGPDGIFYLTGTRARIKYQTMDQEQESRDPDGKLDFLENNGIRLWSSTDLVNWTDRGLTLDLMSLKYPEYASRGVMHGYRYGLPERTLGDRAVMGVTSPRLHFVGGDCYYTYSIVGRDVRWAKADKPDGKLVNWRQAPPSEEKRHGQSQPMEQSRGPGHGSFFTDSDGAGYLVWGPGYLAALDGKKKPPGLKARRCCWNGCKAIPPPSGAPNSSTHARLR